MSQDPNPQQASVRRAMIIAGARRALAIIASAGLTIHVMTNPRMPELAMSVTAEAGKFPLGRSAMDDIGLPDVQALLIAATAARGHHALRRESPPGECDVAPIGTGVGSSQYNDAFGRRSMGDNRQGEVEAGCIRVPDVDQESAAAPRTTREMALA